MKKIIITAIAAVFIIASCTKDKSIETGKADPNSNYPDNVSIIINNKCSITGCHTTQSKAAAGGLAMETWDKLFEGGSGGAVVIPYRPDQSWTIYYTNTDTSRGIVLTPTMPYLRAPLTDQE